jgi:hypothetical protein
LGGGFRVDGGDFRVEGNLRVEENLRVRLKGDCWRSTVKLFEETMENRRDNAESASKFR